MPLEVEMGMRPLRVAIVTGGPSAEREISLRSAGAVRQTLVDLEADVSVIDPGPQRINPDQLLQEIQSAKPDAVFIAMHGHFGEDGQLQSLLENAGISFTGSGSLASAAAFDKSRAKNMWREAGLPVLPQIRVTADSTDGNEAALLQRCQEELRFPCIIKPNADGSSVGIRLASNPEELSDALETAYIYSHDVLIEEFVTGQEWSVGFYQRECLAVTKIRPVGEIFDFDAKYVSGETDFEFISPGEPGFPHAIAEITRQACEVIGTTGLTRVDIREDEQGNPWLLEINTVPGMTLQSQIPRMAECHGIGFPTLCRRLLKDAAAQQSFVNEDSLQIVTTD
ncbi:D-alanine--D-alanine ligase family protein [Calycomorphotria hydatis]|uniref:D-alanine--D-alanine ligase n=1 Tax=Calycomorphotria hydatis TaxID=2528027 RepID=A0A517T6F5_9PLAN|nr:D-alanine--D-alanine ligase [Calycomorphotria hydatis]QDT63957.1 D-alanine--D-alanine ligase Ddl [Calycomorphotria hydatis]